MVDELDLKKKITDFHYGKSSILLSLLFYIPSIFYSIAIKIKNRLYEKNILKEEKMSPYIICVGNLTTGGVGKTPIVIELANFFFKMGKKTVVISRGYGGYLNNREVNLIKTYDKIIVDNAELSGDEVALIAKKTGNVAILTCKDRKKAVLYAKEKLNAEIIIFDDGFSNRKVKKDLNIVLVDANKMFGNGALLPLGPLREPVCEIKRADKVIVVNKDNIKNPALDEFLADLTIPWLPCDMLNGAIYNIKTGEILRQDCRNVVAFSGIGQPKQFYAQLNSWFNLLKTVSFDDHVKYSQQMIDSIAQMKNETGAEAIITTEKDMVKLGCFRNIFDIYALELRPRLDIQKLFQQ